MNLEFVKVVMVAMGNFECWNWEENISFESFIFQGKRVDQSLLLGKESLNGNILVLFHGGIQKIGQLKKEDLKSQRHLKGLHSRLEKPYFKSFLSFGFLKNRW
jgi:hypothetical protein